MDKETLLIITYIIKWVILPLVFIKVINTKVSFGKVKLPQYLIGFHFVLALFIWLICEINHTERIPDPFHLPTIWLWEWVTKPLLLALLLALLLIISKKLLRNILNLVDWIQNDKNPLFKRLMTVAFILWVADLVLSLIHSKMVNLDWQKSPLFIPARYPWVYYVVIPSMLFFFLRQKDHKDKMTQWPKRGIKFIMRVIDWFLK